MVLIIVVVVVFGSGEEVMRAEEVADGARRGLYAGDEAALGRTIAWSLLC